MKFGMAIAAKMPMIATTIISSMSVKPFLRKNFLTVVSPFRVGRLFVERGGIPDQDTFSAIDPRRPWIPLEWGYQLIVYGLDRAGGLSMLRFAHGATQWAAFVLLWWGFRRRMKLDAASAILLLT